MVGVERAVVRGLTLGVVLVAVLGSPKLCPGWDEGHRKITEAALDALPDWQRTQWRPVETSLRQACGFPDAGLKNAAARPYLIQVKGRLFHYFPRENAEDFQVFNEGAERYLRLIVGRMRDGNEAEAAKFAGAFAHVLEDLGQPQCHALEGINGFSWTLLDELFTPTDQTWNRAPQSIVSLDNDRRFAVRLGNYRPQLLGTHPREAAFRLYQRASRVRQIARKALPAMLTHSYAGEVGRAVEAMAVPAAEDARLVADMFATCFAMAERRFEPDAIKTLETFDLTTLVPIAAPALISKPYRFSPLAYGCSVDVNRRPVPLRVWLAEADGQPREVTLAKGIGTGCCRFRYELPPGVFREFRCTAGLHSQLGLHRAGANLRLSIRFAGREVFHAGPLAAKSLAQKVNIAVAAGGALEFVSEGRPGLKGNEANHAVWGEPVLVRLEDVAF